MTPSDILTLATAAAGITVSYFFFLRSQKLKKPCWAIRSNNLITNYGPAFSKLEVSYNCQKVENLTVSKLLFWNAGAETIQRQDIVLANPLTIVAAEGTNFLDVEILAQNNLYSDFMARLSDDKLRIIISFDYLDQSHGAVLQVIHTGLSSSGISVEGSLKGVMSIKRKKIRTWLFLLLPTSESFDRRIRPSIRRRINICVYLAITICSVFFLYAMVFPRYLTYPAPFDIFIGLFFLAYALFGLMRSFDLLTNSPPKGLDAFED